MRKTVLADDTRGKQLKHNYEWRNENKNKFCIFLIKNSKNDREGNDFVLEFQSLCYYFSDLARY